MRFKMKLLMNHKNATGAANGHWGSVAKRTMNPPLSSRHPRCPVSRLTSWSAVMPLVNAGSSVASIQRRLGACQDNWWCVVLYCHVCVWALVDTEIAEKSKKPKQQGELSRSAVVKMKTPPEPTNFSKAKREAELRRETRMKAVLTDQSKINA